MKRGHLDIIKQGSVITKVHTSKGGGFQHHFSLSLSPLESCKTIKKQNKKQVIPAVSFSVWMVYSPDQVVSGHLGDARRRKILFQRYKKEAFSPLTLLRLFLKVV